MARAKTNKLYRTFVKGLITEAGYLTYPEDASIAELNTILSRKGNRTRRLGVDYEEDFVFTDVLYSENEVLTEHTWYNVNNDPLTNFVVIQMGNRIYFYEINNGAVSANKKNFMIDLFDYNTSSSTSSDIITNEAQFASGAGYLFLTHPYVEPLNIEYDAENDTIIVTAMIITIRDLDGVDDGLPNDMEPTSLSKTHHYNLLNQGWGAPGSGSQISYYYNPYSGSAPSGSGSSGTSTPPSTSTSGGYTVTPYDRKYGSDDWNVE